MLLSDQDPVRSPASVSILVVDDSRSYRYLLVNLLRSWRYQVFEAENGQQALEMLVAQPIDMVISDWEMPELDGLALCRAIRQQETKHYIYLILLTARNTIDDLITGLEAGADDFLSKPMHQSELRARLHSGGRILALEAMLAARNRKLLAAYQQMEADLRVAAQLQHSVLPQGPVQEQSLHAEWLFLPSSYLSGDMLNFFALGSQHVGFYSVDVAGHGIGAAMLSLSVARQFLHGRLADNLLFSQVDNRQNCQINPPHQVVVELNRRFCLANQEGMSYFTLIYGVIQTATGQGVLCQAGHPTPLVVSPQGAVRTIGEGGGPVGLVEQMTYQDSEFCLLPGERFYLFTDGVSECENPQQQLFGTERLQQLLAASCQLPAEQVLARVEQTLLQWRHGEMRTDEPDASHSTFTDDVSLMLIEREVSMPSPAPTNGRGEY